MEKTSGTPGITILADHDIEGKARLLYHALRNDGWTDLCAVRMILFADVGLADNSTDRDVWRFAQRNGMILLTGNRNMENENSLEQTLRMKILRKACLC
jgi:predicted nuclease of predicted toxin-antitoxin system